VTHLSSPPASGVRAVHPAIAAAFKDCRRAFRSVALFSAVVNLLMLAGPLYMLQVYDRVLASHSVPTLIGLSVLLCGAFAIQASLDLIRNRLATRSAGFLDEHLSAVVHRAVIRLSASGRQTGEAHEPVRDLDLQLRLKEVEDDAIRRATRVLKPIAQERGVAFIMNDRPDLAHELDCDGVHVGEEDMPYAEARRLLGSDRIVGVTCGSSRDRAITAAEAGADYVAFGAFFPSSTKAAKHHADPELIRDWSETTVVPCCAIGGITQQNCGPLVEAGADFLAVIGAIWSYPEGPRAAVAAFNEVFERYGRAFAG
jgi:thiamine-phosphate pyrophosphorylase